MATRESSYLQTRNSKTNCKSSYSTKITECSMHLLHPVSLLNNKSFNISRSNLKWQKLDEIFYFSLITRKSIKWKEIFHGYNFKDMDRGCYMLVNKTEITVDAGHIRWQRYLNPFFLHFSLWKLTSITILSSRKSPQKFSKNEEKNFLVNLKTI